MTEARDLTFEYVVRRSSVPDSVEHLHFEFGAYTAERQDDVLQCTDKAPLMNNRYDPEPTPLRTPAGQCTRFDTRRIDLAAADGPWVLGPYTVPGNRANAHTLVVHDVELVLENGSTASAVYDTDFRAITDKTPPSGAYGVEFNVTDYEGTDRDVPWRFGIEVAHFEAGDG